MTSDQRMGALVLFALLLVAGTIVGAMILRAAVSLYNRLATPPNCVTEPKFGAALLIALATTFTNLMAGLLVSLLTRDFASAAGWSPRTAVIVAQLLSLPVCMAVMAGMLSSLLPTTFRRGLIVTACYLAVAFAVSLVIGIFAAIVISLGRVD